MGEERPADFDQIVETTGLDPEQIDSLKKGFDGFDKEGGTINQTTMMMILKSMGVDVNKVDMENYSSEDDEEQMKEELKEAFRIYDQENQGFITNDILKEILREIDSTLTEEDLDHIVEEVDEDGSGTMDFDEFQEMMMG